MHNCIKAALAAGLLLMSSSALKAQLAGTVTVPSVAYPTLASVVTALNAQGVGSGGVIVNITALNPQLAPSGGYLLGSTTLNASTSATNTITINGNANTVTASVGTSTTTDGIFIIQGVDNLTINSLNLSENVANITPTTQMEWGYALVKLNATAPIDGCQNVKIQNCAITLNKANSGSIGIYANNHIAGNTTQLSFTAAADANSSNKLYGNTIQNCYSGIYFNGATVTTPFFDVSNDIGGTTATTGNTIQNFGGGTVSQTGIFAANQVDPNISRNTINNAAGGGSASGNAALYGIYQSSTGNVNITNNTLILQAGTTGNSAPVSAILDVTSGTGSTTISNNTITGTGGGTGIWYGIELAGTSPATTVSGNLFKDINLTNTGLAHLIHQTALAPAATINITNNATTGTTPPYVQKVAGGSFSFYFNTVAGAATNTNISGNTVTQVQLTGATVFYGLYAYDVTGAGIKNVSNNTVSNIANIATSTSAMYGVAASFGATSNVYGNTISNISGGGIIYGINLMSNTVANAYRNKVTGINGAGTNATVYAIYCNSAAGPMSVYNNFMTDLTAPLTSSNTGVNGIYAATGMVNAYNNTIVIGKTAAITGGANFSCAGIYSSSPLVLKNNIIYVNATPTGTGVAACVKRNVAGNVAGTAPLPASFTAGNNVYYINTGAQNYLYEEGITAAAVKNGYALSGLTTNTTTNVVNDAFFNRACSAYKNFMAANGESNSYTENNITALTAGTYAPTGSSYAESGGVVIPTVTDDYSGAARTTPPDIGALQFGGTTIVPATVGITYTALSDRSVCAAPPVLSAAIAASGSNTINNTTAAPRLYFKKTSEANVFGTYPTDNTASFNGWKYVTATGTAPNFSLAIDYSLLFSPIAAQDTIQYFVVAEDNATVTNAGINTAAFTNVYCLTGVNILPAAGGVAALPATNRFIILAKPPFTISSSHDTICRNAIRAIAVTSTAGNYSSYTWSPAANLYTDAAATVAYTGTSATTVYVKQTAPGNTVYTASATNGTAQCISTLTDTITIQAIDTMITGSHDFCVGDSATLVAATGFSYQWLNSGVGIAGATAATYTVHSAGSYSVILTTAQGCRDSSAQHVIIANPLPTPVITQSGTTLTVAGAYTAYEWRMNGTVIAGATTATITFTAGASYTVTVTDAAGCKGTSPVYTLAQGGVNGVGSNSGISVYPNPAQDELTINAAIPINASVCTMDGRCVLQVMDARKFSIGSLAAGMYVLRITDKGNRLVAVMKLLKKD